MTTMIEVDNLGKRYRLGGQNQYYSTLREDLVRFLKRPLRGRTADRDNVFWALRDVSFSVEAGEVVGIIGRNGAGKSTLLKLLSRITRPTEGRADLFGRVGSLLEVGTGFHPELTGRENIYLSGAILGMTRAEIRDKFDQIVAFSEIEQFLDTPVKHYSSGMYVRLGFAVAAHLEPEILLIDEVLAVGDASFQKKCLGKMNEVARGGKAVLFVSHNMGAVTKLCTRCMLIDRGTLVSSGDPHEVTREYLDTHLEGTGRREWTGTERPGNDHLRLNRFWVTDAQGQTAGCFARHQDIHVHAEIELGRDFAELRTGFDLLTVEGTAVFCSHDVDTKGWYGASRARGTYHLHTVIPGMLLNATSFTFVPVADIPAKEVFYRVEDCLTITVTATPHEHTKYHDRIPGVVRPPLTWTIEKVN